MSAAGSYCRWNVETSPERPRRPAPSRPSTTAIGSEASPDETAAPDPTESSPTIGLADRVDLSGLSIAGISRRHVAWLAGGLLATWIVIAFARQVGDAAAASARAGQLAADNAALASEVSSLQGELDLIVRPTYVAVQARGVGLGAPHEIAFSLDPRVPAPVDGAPGSASARLGSSAVRQTPLESWLSLLFGPGT